MTSNLPPYDMGVRPPTPPQLPSYESGVSISEVGISHKSRPAPIIQLMLDPKLKETYDVGDLISGKVVITPARDMKFSEIVVDIAETESVIRSRDYPDTRVSRTFSIAKHSPSLEAFPRDMILRKKYSYSFEFALFIPEDQPNCAFNPALSLHRYLPPSMGASPEGRSAFDRSDLSALLYYCLRVRVLADSRNARQSVAEHSIDLRILPSHAPVSYIDDSRAFRQVAPLTQRMLVKSHLGNLELKIRSVPTFFIGRSFAEMVNLQLYYVPVASGQCSPPSFRKITTKLLSHTVSSVNMMDFYPLPRQRGCLCHTEILETRRIVKPKIVWQAVRRNEYAATIPLPLFFAKHLKLVPTFYSCLMSRQYELQVVLSTGSAHSSLKVPLTIAYDRGRRPDGHH